MMGFRFALAVIGMALAAATPAAAQHWTRSWEVAMQTAPASLARAHPQFKDRTLRQIVRLSIGGDHLRVRFSNELTPTPTRLGVVRIAKVDERGTIVRGTEQVVRFSGKEGTTMAPKGSVLSDPIDLKTVPFDRIAVSIYFPDEIASPTYHDYANATHWFADGDQTGAAKLRNPALFISMAILSGIDVENAQPLRTIVAFGDSITDGAHATLNLDRRWPDLLARRLQQTRRNIGVVNAGIGGNQLLRNGGALGGVNRFERDALNVPGVSHVIVLEGVNDLGIAAYAKIPLPTPEQMIEGYRQMITLGHARGVKVILATITPYKGSRYWSEDGENVRQAVNRWIRENKEADGFVDFDKAVADPADPQTIAKQFNDTDKLHPNDQGFLAMANAINLNLFR